MTYVSLNDVRHRPVSAVLEEICRSNGFPLISGGSGRGWSYWAAMQQCPRFFEYRYVNTPRRDLGEYGDRPAREIGSTYHAFQYFWRVDVGKEPEWLYAELQKHPVQLSSVHEAWRVFDAYRFHYQDDYLWPLAGEYHVEDIEAGRTCRYDLVAEVRQDGSEVSRGTYIVEYKTAGAFTEQVIDGWDLDGEVLGQISLWNKCGLDALFGKLQGVIVDVAGKQKRPLFHRVVVSPTSFQLKQYSLDLAETARAIDRCKKTGYYPRYLKGCIHRYGFCDFYDLCRNEMGEEEFE